MSRVKVEQKINGKNPFKRAIFNMPYYLWFRRIFFKSKFKQWKNVLFSEIKYNSFHGELYKKKISHPLTKQNSYTFPCKGKKASINRGRNS